MVCYVNSSAQVQAKRCCCTSSNTKGRRLRENDEIILYRTKPRKICRLAAAGKAVYFYDFTAPPTIKLHPRYKMLAPCRKCKVLVHQECTPDVIASADLSGHVADYRLCRKSPARDFIIRTESGIFHQLQSSAPKSGFSLHAANAMRTEEQTPKKSFFA